MHFPTVTLTTLFLLAVITTAAADPAAASLSCRCRIIRNNQPLPRRCTRKSCRNSRGRRGVICCRRSRLTSTVTPSASVTATPLVSASATPSVSASATPLTSTPESTTLTGTATLSVTPSASPSIRPTPSNTPAPLNALFSVCGLDRDVVITLRNRFIGSRLLQYSVDLGSVEGIVTQRSCIAEGRNLRLDGTPFTLAQWVQQAEVLGCATCSTNSLSNVCRTGCSSPDRQPCLVPGFAESLESCSASITSTATSTASATPSASPSISPTTSNTPVPLDPLYSVCGTERDVVITLRNRFIGSRLLQYAVDLGSVEGIVTQRSCIAEGRNLRPDGTPFTLVQWVQQAELLGCATCSTNALNNVCRTGCSSPDRQPCLVPGFPESLSSC